MNDTLTPAARVIAGIAALNIEPEQSSPVYLTTTEAKALLAALPADLVAAATVEMPKEPGLYVGPEGILGHVWRVGSTEVLGLYREAVDEFGEDVIATPADGPFRRLVVERERHVFTPAELRDQWIRGANPDDKWRVVANYVNSKEA